jgi:hypothetical protein
MIFDLAKDFHDALAAMSGDHLKRRIFELLEEAIRHDIHFIARHPTTLFQCLWNTWWWYDCRRQAKEMSWFDGQLSARISMFIGALFRGVTSSLRSRTLPSGRGLMRNAVGRALACGHWRDKECVSS